MTVNEVVAEVIKDRVFFEESGGGVTFSGGEPLGQADFLAAALRACQGAGLHTAVDTCGLAPWQQLRAVAGATDLILFDIKIIDDARHREHTGVSNRQILHNLQRLGERHSQIWLRVPVIPGVNDHPENLEAIARLVATIPTIERVCLLPYHPLGEDKLKRSGRTAQLAPIDRPTPASLQSLVALVEAAGVSASIGG
jgi:pyruvate formate lyase activating enzyme